jgi:hypothetical protein
MADRADYIEQIIRDQKVLADDPHYHQPSAEFYEDRVAGCMSELHNLAQKPQEEKA